MGQEEASPRGAEGTVGLWSIRGPDAEETACRTHQEGSVRGKESIIGVFDYPFVFCFIARCSSPPRLRLAYSNESRCHLLRICATLQVQRVSFSPSRVNLSVCYPLSVIPFGFTSPVPNRQSMCWSVRLDDVSSARHTEDNGSICPWTTHDDPLPLPSTLSLTNYYDETLLCYLYNIYLSSPSPSLVPLHPR